MNVKDAQSLTQTAKTSKVLSIDKITSAIADAAKTGANTLDFYEGELNQANIVVLRQAGFKVVKTGGCHNIWGSVYSVEW